MDHLSMHFGISVSSIHRFIHKVLPVLHAYLVPKYIRWHTMNKWRSLVGTIPEFPSVVAKLQIAHRIESVNHLVNTSIKMLFNQCLNRFLTWMNYLKINVCNLLSLAGPIQRLFYRGDRHCHFMNWYVIVDLNGFIVYSRPGFLGHLNDATCFRCKYRDINMIFFFLITNCHRFCQF